MDRILKERYKYTPLGLLSEAHALRPGLVEIEVEAAACLFRKRPLARDEMHLPLAYAADDPLLTDNLDTEEAKIQGVQIDIPDHMAADGVLYVHFRYPAVTSSENEKGRKYVLRNAVRVGRNASVRIVIYHHHCSETTNIINTVTAIEAAEGATVELIEIAESRATYFGTLLTSAQRDVHIKVTTIDLDNAFLRRNQFVTLTEPGAECDLEGVYMTDAAQHCDNFVRMHHAVPHCTSNQLFKGVAADESHAIFTGQIYVAKDAQKTVALQENHNIVLSDKARIDTRPQLEIYADDVKCNHGATIGRLDPEAIYYMRQRGIGIEAAKRLQIEGFIDDIIDHCKVEDLQHLLRDKVSKRLQNS